MRILVINYEYPPKKDPQKWGLSPYTRGETAYYFLKHLALPGTALGIILLTLGIRGFDSILAGILINIIYFNTGFIKTIFDSVFRESRIMFFSRKALLLGRSNDLAASQQTSRTIVVKARNPQHKGVFYPVVHRNKSIVYFKNWVEFLKKKTIKGLERNHRFLELLKRLEITELKPTFDSVYTHALVKYSNETVPVELVKLFALKAVKKAFEEEFYNDSGKEGILATVVSRQFQSNEKLAFLKKIYSNAGALNPEIEKFNPGVIQT